MRLSLLPTRTGSAAENMATDFLLLQRYPEPAHARFRHYGWHRPAFTFGYSQKIAFIRSQLPADPPADLCRRFTGGGLVDHREDWTYSLVIPRGHPLETGRALESYRSVHEALASALRELGQSAEIKRECEPPVEGESCAPAGVCFTRAERYDVIDPATGLKIAGAAQKRNKNGLSLQGSLWRPSAPAITDWDAFRDAFAKNLAAALTAEPTESPWPDFPDGELEALTETYTTPEWLDQR